MLFLITKKQKDKILDEYYSGVINIFTIILFVLFIMLLALLFPTYLNMNVDKKILKEKISPLQAEISEYQKKASEVESLGINDNVSILNLNTKKNTVEIYRDIKEIYKKIPNVEIISINVNSLDKKVNIVANIDNKNTANLLVDTLNSTKYKGADLPYSVFSQNQNFIFSQTLNYE